MKKIIIVSKGNAFGIPGGDTVWGYVTSEENAKLLCDELASEEGDFYYTEDDCKSNINLDATANFIRESRENKLC